MKTLNTRTLISGVTAAALGCMLGAATGTFAKEDDDKGGKGNDFSARLSGFNEVHFIATPTPALRGAVSSKGSGSFKLHIDDAAGKVHYELTYQDLEGSVTQSHIHFGQRHTTGGITVWLCQTAGTLAPLAVRDITPFCPEPGGTVTGTFDAKNVLAVTGQGIDTGEFDEVIRAIRAGTTYANVHSTLFTPGEIRGQIRHGGGHGKGK